MHFGTDIRCLPDISDLFKLQIWAHRLIVVVDIVAIPVDVAVVVDICCIITIVARRPQPPPSILSLLIYSKLL